MRGITLKPGGPSAPARLSLCPILPEARTGIPETPPARPLPTESSLSLLSRASVLPFQIRPSSSIEWEGRICKFSLFKGFYIKVRKGYLTILKMQVECKGYLLLHTPPPHFTCHPQIPGNPGITNLGDGSGKILKCAEL